MMRESKARRFFLWRFESASLLHLIPDHKWVVHYNLQTVNQDFP
jgi:hypothetical protein